jgi:hypothetical protein
MQPSLNGSPLPGAICNAESALSAERADKVTSAGSDRLLGIERAELLDRIERALIVRRDILLRECSQIQRSYDRLSGSLLRRHTDALDELFYMNRVLNTYRSSRAIRLRAWRAA